MWLPDGLDLVRETMEAHGQAVGGRREGGTFFSAAAAMFSLML